MNIDEATTFKDQKEKLSTFLEIADTEKQLLASIYSKGLLNKDVQDLYHKARSSYENIILNDYEALGLQEVEYSLWKLHYKHIDEFRKRIRQANAEKKKSEGSESDTNSHLDVDKHMEGFKSLLSEATDFYQDLVKKLRKSCGLPLKFPQCQYVCHRFLVCLGDLARYTELCKKPDACKWSASAAYYLEASRIWPDSGNPHNQLALLATYISDPFLALYHCVRSLAVKEPFPDAWNNLMLLFEENRSSHFHSLSNEAYIDLLKPSEKTSLQTVSRPSSGSSNINKLESNGSVSSEKSDIWPLFVRLISFFLVISSLEDFSHTLASTVRQLEALLALGDEELKAALDSYQHMEPSRSGPYRALQLVTVFIYIIHSLTESGEGEVMKAENKESDLTKLALAAIFICTGRLIERCLKGSHPEVCPLLPAVLVFAEWLVNTLERAEAYAADERVRSSMSYFFGAFSDLLNRLELSDNGISLDYTALWEDYELRGFDPLAHAHMTLDFTSHRECVDNFSSMSTCRSWRIFLAAKKLSGRSRDSNKWIMYDELEKKFYTVKSRCPDKVKEDVAVTAEEEEVILFKPIMRHNSEPIYTSTPGSDQFSVEGLKEVTTLSDESLRRSTSLITGQNLTGVDPLSFYPDTANFRYTKPFKPQEPTLRDSAAYPAGPPSLNAWVLDSGSSRKERGVRGFNKHELSPIEELASQSFNNLSINETKDPITSSSHVSDTPYVTPVPSAPLLPEDASWFKGNSLGFPEFKSPSATKEGNGILGAPPVSVYSNRLTTRGPFDFVAGPPGFVDGYPPQIGMSSSEWLYHYRNTQNVERVNNNNHLWPSHVNAPTTLGNLSTTNVARFDFLDQWGNRLVSSPMVYLESPQLLPSPLMYSVDEQRRDKPLLSFQRSSPYSFGAGMELKPPEQPILPHYLKDSEWQVQPESQYRAPSFMGN
ncbi:PREDICTED: protein SMG7L-like [Ipomoea nil]|uniref:protein SMG7L-like n=1 Tax=Ipomoea nil TaxID=35883 RepID=UPI00090142EF|nr:PREDICTED: protein SMG7L-like [Ipomoea nil]